MQNNTNHSTENLPNNTCEIEFITDGDICSYKNYNDITVKVNMRRYVPTRKFLNEIADTLAADMIDYIKNGSKATKITARLVYSEAQGEQTA